MDKREFLSVLREQLEGVLSPNAIEGHVRYYDQYITDEIRAGRSETEVLEELGSPVFIAKTLTDVAADFGGDSTQSDDTYQSERTYEDEQHPEGFGAKLQNFLWNTGLARVLIPIGIVLVMTLVLFTVGTVAAVAFRLFAPIILVAAIVYIFRNFIR